jgi:hypothetical protein
MQIKIAKYEDEQLIREFAAKHKLPCTKAVIHAVKMAEDVHFMQGQVASLKFFIKCLREEHAKKNPLIR